MRLVVRTTTKWQGFGPYDLLNMGISLFTNHNITHVGIIVNETEEYYEVSEARPPKSGIYQMYKSWLHPRIQDGRWDIIEFKDTKISKEKFMKVINEDNGKPYAFKEYIGFVLYAIFGIKFFKDNDKYRTCGEDVYRKLIKLGYKIQADKPDYVYPGKVVDLLILNGYMK